MMGEKFLKFSSFSGFRRNPAPSAPLRFFPSLIFVWSATTMKM